VQNAIVTITYSKGTVLDAILLSHDEHEIRAAVAGIDDTLTFTCVHGTWISEDLEPVSIGFAWQRTGTAPALTEGDCLCPRDLAARLIHSLFNGDEQGAELAFPIEQVTGTTAAAPFGMSGF
jgi:hypothetical protein